MAVKHGHAAPTRAASTGIDITDGTTEVAAAQEIDAGHGLTVIDLGADIAQIAVDETTLDGTLIPGAGGSVQWFNVMEGYGAVRDSTTDDTSAINSAIAALIAAGGGVLYFPGGTGAYKVTSSLSSITVPCTILGDGMAGNDTPGIGASTITWATTTGRLFDLNSRGITMRGLALTQTGGTPTSGCEAIRAGHSTAFDFGRIEGVSTSGWYHAINIENGTGYTVAYCLAHGFAHHGFDILYNSVPDGLDCQIIGNHADGATYSAAVGFYMKSAGGAKFIGNKVNSNSGLVYGIMLDVQASTDASVLIITGNSIEGWSTVGVVVVTTAGTSIIRGIVITGNEIANTVGGDHYAVFVQAAETDDLYEVVVVGNKLGGNSSGSGSVPAVYMEKVNWPLVSANTWRGFSQEAQFVSCSNVRDGTGMIGSGVQITGAAVSGYVPTATGTAAATWQAAPGGGVTGFATPAVVLGTAAAAGAATTVIRSDATVVAFDATAPTTQALGDSAATGSAAVAARRDHKHAMPALSSATPLVESGSGSVGTAIPSSREDHVHPAAAATDTAGSHVHVVGETHLSDGSTTTYILDQAFEPGSVEAFNTTTLAYLTVTETDPDTVTVSAAGSAGDKITFSYAGSLA